ncbi:MAG: hypothetical protein M1812_007755 [Candelaria pacifica]|nr:MAG: hypothetical protein M1812_007755 [Candelaria pacifica]
MAETVLSPTSTSHIPSAGTQHQPVGDLHSSSDQALISTLSGSPYTFLQPPPSLHLAALVLAKRYLDPLASSISEVQLQRQQAARKKRKRGEDSHTSSNGILQLKGVHLDDRFSVDQVWAQAKRILDATRDEVERDLPQILQINQEAELEHTVTNVNTEDDKQLRMVRFDDDGFEISGSEEDHLGEDGVEWEVEDEEDAEEDMEGSEADAIEEPSKDAEDAGDAEDAEDIEMDEEPPDGESSGAEEPTDIFKEDPNGLNDGFFSIDDFNKQSEFLERQDGAGDPFDGAASDEEEIDWDADPMTIQPTVSQSGTGETSRKEEVDEEDDDDVDVDEGPTFGNADLNAPQSDSDDEPVNEDSAEEAISSMPEMQNTNEIHYADFFAPPARKASKAPRIPHARNLPPSRPTQPTNTNPDDIQRTISAVRRDLFEDELSANEEEDSTAEQNPTDPKTRRSTHERRQSKLSTEIRRLEAANVAKREWTLSGEARASDRPLNSLLEEDLDFERTGKPVPVITNEVSEGIEDLIKRRILAQEFDEVIRRRPDSLITSNASTRRGRFELEDTKAQQSLAEMYEQDHLRKIDPEGFMDKRDEKLKKEHSDIDTLWKDVCSKLDALSSWHYKPKPPTPSVNIVADVPTISMEDARPSAGADIGGGASMLAPQEVYAPGKEGFVGRGEVVLKSGAPVGREEMTREEKLRRRRREKERIKKSGMGKGPKKESKGEKEKREVVGSLKRGGVKVIGKKGEIRDVEGGKIREQRGGKGAGGFKL